MEYSTYKYFEKIYEVKLKDLVANDLFLEAIHEFKSNISGNKQIESDLVLIENRYARVQKDFRVGLVSIAERNIERTKLAKSFLDYIDEMVAKECIYENNETYFQDDAIETIKQIMKGKLGEKDIETENIIIIKPSDVDFWTSGTEPFDPVTNSSKYIAFWLLMKKSEKRFAVYSPNIISIGDLAEYLAGVVLPHMKELNYKWQINKVNGDKTRKVSNWLSLKVCSIKDGDNVYISGKYSPPPPIFFSGPKPGFPQKADPSMLSSKR